MKDITQTWYCENMKDKLLTTGKYALAFIIVASLGVLCGTLFVAAFGALMGVLFTLG